MTDEPTKIEMTKSIDPRSEQLNADDLVSGPITVTIKGVRRGSKEQPINVDLVEYDRPFRPCKTMRRVLIATFTDNPSGWIGQKMTLFCDPTIVFGGVKVGGIRISHLSGIDKPKTFLLTQTRGKKAEVTIHPIQTLSATDQAYVDDAKNQIAEAPSMEVLNAIGFVLKEKSPAIQDAVRPTFKARKKELEGQV